MKTLLRTTLLAAVVLLGAQAVAQAQQPDSILTISHQDSTLLRLNTDAGFVVRGTPEVGKIPAEGLGVRMMWFPARWAFRAGRVHSSGATYWDLPHIGEGSVAFGENTRASGRNSVALGDNSTASAERSFVVNGTASGINAVAIGFGAKATEMDALAMGRNSISSGLASIVLGPSIATGDFGVAIGLQNSASGTFSMAIGKNARTANRQGSIVLGDGCAGFDSDSVFATAKNQFVARGCGGFKFYTSYNLSSGVEIEPGGGSWNYLADAGLRSNTAALDGEWVLTQLRDMPVTTWSYSAPDALASKHAGPTAQDFRTAFGLGASDRHINTVDMDGILLAAIKALDERTRDLQVAGAVIESLRAELALQQQRHAEQQAALASLAAQLDAFLAADRR